MSNPISVTKIANLILEPDKYSAHTFELSKNLMYTEWKDIKSMFYESSKKHSTTKIYEDEKVKGLFHIIAFQSKGIRISLRRVEHSNGYYEYSIGMIINPRKLIDPKSSYIGIFPPNKESVDELKSKFSALFKGTAIPNDIDSYKLKRVDLCVNIRCNHKKIFREIVRVIRKLPTPPKYERKLSEGKDCKKINKHTLRFACGTHILVIYDKTFQITDQGIKSDFEKLPEGVLRFEVQYERKMIRDLENESGETKVSQLLWLLIQESEERVIKHFRQCVADVSFCQLDEILNRINNSNYKEEKREAMRKLAKLMQRKQSVDVALDKMDELGYDTDKILSRFTKLGISPVPLWKNFCA